MADKVAKKRAIDEIQDLNDDANGGATGIFDLNFVSKVDFLAPKLRKIMPKNVPVEIKQDVFN